MKIKKIIGGVTGGALVCGAAMAVASVLNKRRKNELEIEEILNEISRAFANRGTELIDISKLHQANSVHKFCRILSNVTLEDKRDNFRDIMHEIEFRPDIFFGKYNLSQHDYNELMEDIADMYYMYDDILHENAMFDFDLEDDDDEDPKPSKEEEDPFSEYETEEGEDDDD